MRIIPKVVVMTFFIMFLIIGLICYKDYGLSFDEEAERLTGLVTLKYLLQLFYPKGLNLVENINNIPQLNVYVDRIYSPHFQLTCLLFKEIFSVKGTRDTFLLSHLINFLVFYIGVVLFYKILKEKFYDWKICLFGTALLVLSPRIFADSFYNSKDIVFLTASLLCCYTFIIYFKNRKFKYLVYHAFTSALAIDIRIMALLFPFLTFVFIFLEKIQNKRNFSIRQAVLASTSYCLLLTFFVWLLWPYLWESPLNNFLAIFNKLNRNGMIGHVLFNGQILTFNNLPWYYIPEWILISTPVIYTCFFILGNFILIKQIFLNKVCNQDILAFSLFYIPIIAVIWINAILYDGWRHLYFIYPFFLIIVVKGGVNTYEYLKNNMGYLGKKLIPFFWGIFAINMGMVLKFMIESHPYQNVYFNELINKNNIQQKFELDYWGLSHRQALEFLLKRETNAIVNFNASSGAGGLNLEILNKDQRKRLKHVPLKEATYFLTDYRGHPEPYLYQVEVYTINVDGFKIMSVFKLK
ncbi:glycosyltransferase family 39 protein [Adhaeribacter aquaticus]|uniref:glycosyltransferase family 39 protein n=1 Tax=Adhaeribacter aquaticus TaxID=299567 RepID=UPI00047C74C5|nr:glycosyltransferase family 39 protein [Adhaeribacter aquaticus]